MHFRRSLETTSTRHLVLGSGRPIVQQRHAFSKEFSINKTASQTNFLLQGWDPCLLPNYFSVGCLHKCSVLCYTNAVFCVTQMQCL